jgi:tetratricopeptide (TPR) repeat protein
VVERLARALHIEIAAAAGQRFATEGPADDADALAWRASGLFMRHGAIGREAEEACRLCESALALDPENVAAAAMLADHSASRVTSVQTADREADLRRAEQFADRALSIDPRCSHARYAAARVLIARKRPHEAILAAEQCLLHHPSFVPAYLVLCQACLQQMRPDDAITHVERAIRLGPADPYLPIFVAHGAYAHFMLHDDAGAAARLQQALACDPAFPTATAWLAAVQALNGRRDEARALLARYFSLPGTRTRSIGQWRSITQDDRPAYASFRERLYDGLRIAGMPEG